MARTDVHRPGAIVPADYELDDYFGHWRVPGDYDCQDNPLYEYYGEEAIQFYEADVTMQAPTPWAGDARKCDVCGARYVHGALFTHMPTGHLVTMGQDCAEKYGVAARLTDRQRGMRAGRTARRLIAKRGMRELLRRHPGLNAALKADHHISTDLRSQAIRRGKLSDAQVALAFKLKAQADKRAEREAAEAELNWIPVPETDKRFKVTATVLGFKTVEGYFGEASTKMIIRCEHEGGFFKLYGTAPNAMFDTANVEHYELKRAIVDAAKEWNAAHGLNEYGFAQDGSGTRPFEAEFRAEWDEAKAEIPEYRGCEQLKGQRIQFMARVQRSGDDENFGFFKRPTKLVILED